MNNYKRLLLPLIAVAFLQGCAAAAVVGIAGTASVLNDRRSVGSQIDDQTIEVKAAARIADSEILTKNTNMQVVSLNGTVLVVGQATSNGIKKEVLNKIRSINGIVQLHDQLKVQDLTSLATRSKDVWLTSKVKTNLLANKRIDGTAIKVVTENSEVFLMGLVSTSEAATAVDVARNITGVKKVVKAFEYR